MKIKALFLFLLLLASSGLYAQNKPCFKAYDAATGQEINAFCVGQKIKIKNCSPVSPTTIQYYDYDKRDGVPFRSADTVNTHTYTAAGDYRISFIPVDPNSGGSGSDSTSRKFTVLPTPKPKFRVIGCAQRNVTVTITDQNYQEFLVDFGDGTKKTVSRGAAVSHQYAPGQPMKVQVTARYTQAVCTSPVADTTVSPLPAAPAPVITQVRLSSLATAGGVILTFDQARPEYFYIIEKNNGNGFAPVDTVKNPRAPLFSRTFNRLNTLNPICWRIRLTDACGTTLNQVSNEVCTLPLSVKTDQQVTLSWPAYRNGNDLKGYQLYRNGNLYRDLPASTTTFVDDKVTCGQEYCYELTGNLNQGAQSFSNKSCITFTATTVPPAPSLISSFNARNQVELKLESTQGQAVKEIIFQKSQEGGGYQDLGKTNQGTFLDSNIKLPVPVCYQAFYLDSCNQASPLSNPTCPSILTLKLNENNTVALSWTSFQGFRNGVSGYLVEKLNESGQVTASVPASGLTFTEPLGTAPGQKLFYRIKVISPNGDFVFSNTEVLELEARIAIPTAFTPNGDNLNDRFEVKSRFIQLTRMTIYNRWGQIIYDGRAPDSAWDGRINGKMAPVGTYAYTIAGKDENGREYVRSGTVALLR